MRCFGEEAQARAIAHAPTKVFSSESRSCGGFAPPDRGAETELLLENAETAPARLVWTPAEAELPLENPEQSHNHAARTTRTAMPPNSGGYGVTLPSVIVDNWETVAYS